MCESSSGSESSQEASGAKGYGRILQRHKQELKLLAQTQKKVIGKAKGKEKKELAAKHSKETEEIQRKHQKELEPFAKPVDDSNDKPQSGGSVEGSDWTNFVSGGLSEETVLKQREAAKAKHEKRQRRKKGEEEELERKREEAAALGPSLKAQEEVDVNKRLSQQGLEMETVIGDGHCLFRAVEHQLRTHGGQEGEETASYLDLRRLAAQYLRENRDEYAELVGALGDEGGDFDEYCYKLETTAVWGGEIELQALTGALKRGIVVHGGLDNPDMCYGDNYDTPPCLHIAFMKYYLSLGEACVGVVGERKASDL
eukprot:GHVN01059242.1.p4 GENE.GHVN01059242.1~~GHVN01059242.1.p4  ORF type:complete len:313 (+),score=66.96 GHVN01059242.1:615-1553(+)